MEYTITIGRRKASIARVYLKDGKGDIIINGKDYKTYFPVEQLQYTVMQPINKLELTGKYEIKINLMGGGIKGQAEAARLGISRALIKINPEYRPLLKPEGFLTRDPREVERKKPGQKKARKRFQFSKR
ncbi:MAG: 30S ribosomal protein S9 [Bacteroidetes bacterium HGW-Bacteroidetes-21]|jgi:small subunit ribosomal protein S9|nr:MAG: 30S ribosomal protein S9 [Bacteroidetes bacterium HGW-Bacteroidetes-21]